MTRFKTVEDGAGFKVEWLDPLLRSKHRNFRPIDVKLGPDGAVYVVDWYNPITCHQDDFYRHPDRDKTHGRIWRVSKRGEAPAPVRQLSRARSSELVDALKSSNHWVRVKAKQVLAHRGLQNVPDKVRDWSGRDLLEAVAMLEWCGLVDYPLLQRLLASDDHRARAFGARVAGAWDAFDLLAQAASDPHPRVRMEAVLACGQIPEANSVLVVADAAEHLRDRWVDYALAQAVHHLRPHWVPAFQNGDLDFGERRKGLALVLGHSDSKGLLEDIRKQLSEGKVDAGERALLIRSLVAVGEDADLAFSLHSAEPDTDLLKALAERDRPEGEFAEPLWRALKHGDAALQAAALELAARWGVRELRDGALQLASRPGAGEELRRAAIRALGTFGGAQPTGLLRAIASERSDALQSEAIAALARIDLALAAETAAREMHRHPLVARDGTIYRALVGRDGGGTALADALGEREISRRHSTQLRDAWNQTGLVDEAVTRRLDKMCEIEVSAIRFDEGLVRELVAAARTGDRARGEKLFASSRGGCAICHKVGETGGVIGPDLSAVGSGVPPERIVTEVLWPAKQVKDGYSLTRVTMGDGHVMQGYVQAGRDENVLLLRDFATSEIRRLQIRKIAKREKIGSLMPPAAQALERQEIADLLAYLFSLGG